MEWVKQYQKKARCGKLTYLLIIICIIIVNVLGILYTEHYGGWWIAPVISFSLPLIIFLFAFMVTQFTVTWRKYNDHYIIFYNAAFKGYLIINGEVQSTGGAFQYDFYGQLPDGTDIYAKVSVWTGSIKFSIGQFNNNIITYKTIT